MPSKTCTVFMIDISSTMGEEIEVPDLADTSQMTRTTGLDLAKTYVKDKIGEKLWKPYKTDATGIFAFGSEKTNNSLDGAQDGYDGIEEIVPTTETTARHFDKLRRLKPSTLSGDAVSAIIVGMSAIDAAIGTKKGHTKELIVVTDGRGDIDWDNIEPICTRLDTAGIELTIVGINFDDDVLGYKEEDKPEVKQTNETMFHNMLDILEEPSICGHVVRAINYVRAPRPDVVANPTLKKMSLTMGDIEDDPEHALNLSVGYYKIVMVKRAKNSEKMSVKSGKRGLNVIEPNRGKKRKLNDGTAEHEKDSSNFGASIGLSQRYAESQTQSMSNHSNSYQDNRPVDRNLSMGVSIDRRSYYVPTKQIESLGEALERAGKSTIRSVQQADEEDREKDASTSDEEDEDEREEVPEDVELVKAYKYGLSKVVVNVGTEDNLLKLNVGNPGIEISIFIPEDAVRHDMVLGSSWFVFGQADSGRSQVAISLLVQAMIEKKRIAIARFTSELSTCAGPKMVALIPHIQKPEEVLPGATQLSGLIMVQLPFREDIRRFGFQSLSVYRNKDGDANEEHQKLPPAALNEAMEDFIDDANLDDADKDEDGNIVPFYSPAAVCNPSVHAMRRATLHRVANPNDTEMPPLHEEIKRYLEQPSMVKDRLQDSLPTLVKEADIKFVPLRPTNKGKGAAQSSIDDEHAKRQAEKGDKMIGFVNKSKENKEKGFTGNGNRLGGPSPAPVDDDKPVREPSMRPLTVADNRWVGLDDPIGDFQRAVNDSPAHQEEAVEELLEVAKELLKYGLGSSMFDRIIACLSQAREHAAKSQLADRYNEIMIKFRGLVQSGLRKKLWNRMKAEKVGLLRQSEVPQDRFSRQKEGALDEEAERYWQ